MRIVKNGSGQNLRDWDPLSRELDGLSLWNEKSDSAKDSDHQPAPTCLHPSLSLRFLFFSFLLLRWEVISSDASVSPTTSLRVGRGPIWAHSLTQMTQSGIPSSSSSFSSSSSSSSSSFSSSSSLSSSSSSPLIRVHPPLLNYAVEFKQNIPRTGETCRAGIWKVHPWKVYQLLNIVNIKACFLSLGVKPIVFRPNVTKATIPWTTTSLIHHRVFWKWSTLLLSISKRGILCRNCSHALRHQKPFMRSEFQDMLSYTLFTFCCKKKPPPPSQTHTHKHTHEWSIWHKKPFSN